MNQSELLAIAINKPLHTYPQVVRIARGERSTLLKSKKSPTVYLVDDDSSARSGLRRLLRSAGFRVVAFASAQEYLDHGPVDKQSVVILDVRMPGMTGLELQQRLQKNGVAPPIVFLTAFEDPHARDEAMAAGASAFLHKPVDEQLLFAAINKVLEGKVETI